jgi:hypothetical protein
VNHPNGSGSVFRDFYPAVPNGANSVIREGIHDKYGMDHTVIPVSHFMAGTNTITLIQRRAATDSSCYVMYDYLDLELPTPAAPSGLAAQPGDAQVGVSWTAAPGATGYYLRQSTRSGGPYQVIAANVSSLDFTQSGLNNGQLYFYTITATNSAGESLVSEVVSARPTSAVMPPLDSEYDAGAGQLTLNWPADHTGWILQMQTNSLATGLGTNWTTVPGSMATNQIVVPVGSDSGSVFFRLASQP